MFAAFALLLSLVELNLNSKTHNLSNAINAERFYRVQMNVKEVIIEAARQGAREGFQMYDSTHQISACPNSSTKGIIFLYAISCIRLPRPGNSIGQTSILLGRKSAQVR